MLCGARAEEALPEKTANPTTTTTTNLTYQRRSKREQELQQLEERKLQMGTFSCILESTALGRMRESLMRIWLC